MKILCTGDIHIGRGPAGLPRDVTGARYSAAVIWGDVVELALTEGVSAVLLSGDVVDRDNRFAEAYGPLERGILKLEESGIRVLTVAGNHDFDVLPSLARNLSGDLFHLFGREGWERVTLSEGDRPVVHVDGWSYPSQHVHESPLDAYRLAPDGLPVIGLLHTDIFSPGNPYAAVTASELRAKPPSFWVLGHIHEPRLLEEPGGVPILYPGAPQAVKADDTGPHGVWILSVDSAGKIEPERVDIERVRYDEVQVDLGGAEDKDGLRERVVQAIRLHLVKACEEQPRLEILCCRLDLAGRTTLLGRLESWGRELAEELVVPAGDARGSIDKVSVTALPCRDLKALAKAGQASPIGLLADLLVALEAGQVPTRYEPLLAGVRKGILEVDRFGAYAAIRPDDDWPREEADRLARELLRRQGLLLLDALLAQKEGEDA